jgi:hypothetical protein
LKETEEYRNTIQNEFYAVMGKIQLLRQQIETLKEKAEQTKEK